MRSGARILRKVEIFFFLEDGTLKVIEPKTDNSDCRKVIDKTNYFIKEKDFFLIL